MTAPGAIPIQTPNIGTTGVLPRSAGIPGLEVIAMALQKRQELELAKQKLAQQREEFELHKKIAGTQLEGMKLENEKKKRALDAEEQALADQDEGERAFVSGLPQADNMQAWGNIIADVKTPGAREHLLNRIKEMFTLRGEAGQAQGQDLLNQQRSLDMAEDRQIHGILQPMAGRQWNRQTISRAVGQVIAINPQKAGQVASAISALLPDYQVVVNDNGTVSYVSKEPEGGVAGAPVEPRRPTDEMNKLGTYAIRVLEGNATMTDLENKFPGIGQRVDDRLRTLRGIEQVPVLGRASATILTPQLLRGLSADERKYVNARIDLGNAFLRRASGAQINLEELDRETSPYVPTFRQPEDVIPSIQQRRLQQGLLFAQQAKNGFDPNRLSPEARRYLLQSIAPNPGYSPDNPFVTQPGTTVVPR